MLFIPYLMSGQYLTFTAGNTAVWAIASPICQTLCISTFSKLMGSKPQGKAMGLLTAAGSLGRIIFPLLTSAFSDTVVFLLCIAFGCISIGCLLVFQKRVKEVNKLTA